MSQIELIRKYILENPNEAPAKIRDIMLERENIDNVSSLHTQIRKELSKKDHSALEIECEDVGIPLDNVKNYWYKGKHFSIHVKKDVDDFKGQIEDIAKRYVPKKNIQLKQRANTITKVLKITLSDMHVGLDPNPNHEGLFQYEYNASIFKRNLEHVVVNAIKEFNTHGVFECLYLDDLGDGLDGYNGQPTRGGHSLDQNMDNKSAFTTFMEGKLWLIEELISSGIANRVMMRNVTNSNHDGDFSFMANYAIKSILSRTYGNTVDFHIIEKFMEHFEYGDHTYILTHGKDKKYMKYGLDLDLKPQTINFITDYINHYNIRSKFIHIEKGDLHQIGYKRIPRFDYRNFMSFAPPSNWVQHNYGDSYSGYSIQVIPREGSDISHTDYFFDLKKKYH